MPLPSFKAYLQAQSLHEGVDDPGIFKCVFMAGGPGSGKSYVAGELFGVDPKIRASFSTFGLKLVSSDVAFEVLLRSVGIDPKELANLYHHGPAWAHAMTVRGQAKRLTVAQQRGYEAGRLGLILDGTGDDYAKLHEKYTHAASLGYDTYMVFVNTSLETALQRNAARPRSLPEALVTESWHAVQQHRAAYQRLFGNAHFLLIDNDEGSTAAAQMTRTIRQWMSRPVENPVGRAWLAAHGGTHRG